MSSRYFPPSNSIIEEDKKKIQFKNSECTFQIPQDSTSARSSSSKVVFQLMRRPTTRVKTILQVDYLLAIGNLHC